MENKENLIKLWEGIRHFHFWEFSSPDETDSGLRMNLEFVKILDTLRDRAGFPLVINSGYRTPAHNAKVGGKSESAHIEGVAADIACSTSGDTFEIVKSAFDLGIKRVGIAETFVHLDMSMNTNIPQRVLWLYPTKLK